MTAISASGKFGITLPLWLSSSLSILSHADTAWVLQEDATPQTSQHQSGVPLSNENLTLNTAETLHDPDPESLGDLLEEVAAMQWSGEAPGFSPPPGSHPLNTLPPSISTPLRPPGIPFASLGQDAVPRSA